jgi:hypothetical protein
VCGAVICFDRLAIESAIGASLRPGSKPAKNQNCNGRLTEAIRCFGDENSVPVFGTSNTGVQGTAQCQENRW